MRRIVENQKVWRIAWDSLEPVVARELQDGSLQSFRAQRRELGNWRIQPEGRGGRRNETGHEVWQRIVQGVVRRTEPGSI